jgi:hypothetical protein
MAIMTMKKLVITNKLTMSGIELISDVIASFKPLFFEISLKGRRILNKRSAFKKVISYWAKTMLKIAEATIKKSRTFQPFKM